MVLGLLLVLFTASVMLFQTTMRKSLQVDKFTKDGHLKPQAFLAVQYASRSPLEFPVLECWLKLSCG